MTMPDTTLDAKTTEPQASIGEALDKVVEGAAKDVKGKEEASKPEETKYTQADWDKRQGELEGRISGLDKKLTTVTQTSKDETSRLGAALEAAQQSTNDARDAEYLRKVESDGGDMDAAKLTIQRTKDSRVATASNEKARITNEARTKELDVRDAILAEAGRGKKATDLIKEHELAADVVDKLLVCKTPEEMEIVALKLAIEKGKVDVKTVTKIDSPDGGGKVDLSKIPLETRMEMAMDGKI